jgi:predicted metal-binding membrane protein
MRKWRTGLAGAFRMGFEHGAYCLGCCWALMLLLFVGGVMNLLVIGALAAFVVAEKLGWLGPEGARVTGGFLIAIGVWIAVR